MSSLKRTVSKLYGISLVSLPNARSKPFFASCQPLEISLWDDFAYPSALEINYRYMSESARTCERKNLPVIPCSCMVASFSSAKPRPYNINKVSGILILEGSRNSIATTKRMNKTRKLVGTQFSEKKTYLLCLT